MKIFKAALVSYLVAIVVVIAVIYMKEIDNFNSTNAMMGHAVVMGNEYATSAMQDTESFRKVISQVYRDDKGNQVGGLPAYMYWANNIYDAGSAPRRVVINRDNYMYTEDAGCSYDRTFNKFMDFLTDEMNRGNVNTQEIFSPMDFGISYLDKGQLNHDMQEYLRRTVTELERFKGDSQFSGYSVDPTSIEVTSELVATPVNISAQPMYNQLIFGTDGTTSSGSINMSENKVIVAYDITYFVRYDYIPVSYFFMIPTHQRDNYSRDDLFYETTIKDAEGKIVPSGRSMLKWKMQDAKQFKFRYIMTH